MKKLLVSDSLKDFIEEEVSVLTKSDRKIFYARYGKEALDIHRKEKVDLIITRIDFPDIPVEQLYSAIRGDSDLKNVSFFLVCSNEPSEVERCMSCGATDCMTEPLNPADFLKKTLRLLSISERTRYRVLVKVIVNEDKSIPFFCTSQNISASGILLETDKVLKKGDKLTCSFFLAHSVRIIIEGVIVRVADKENGAIEYGVMFSNISPSVESQIEAFVEHWLKRTERSR